MNQDIQNALLDLFSVCLEVTGAGRYHAHMTCMAHVDGVHVYVVPASTDYSSTGYEYTMAHRVYFGEEHGCTPSQIVSELADLAGRVNEFLLPAHEEAA